MERKKSNSIIVQVDEATKGIMESITEGITSEISEPLLKLTSLVNGISDSTDDLLKQMRASNSASAQIKSQSAEIAEKSNDIAYKVTQLSESVTTIRDEQKALIDIVSGIDKKLNILTDIIGEVINEKKASDIEIKKVKQLLKRKGMQ